MGLGNDGKTCEVEDAIQRVLCAIRDAGSCTGRIALTPERENKHGQTGVRSFANTTTSLITEAFQQAASARGQPPLRAS